MRRAVDDGRRRLVEAQEHGEGHEEVDAVEGRAHGVGHVAVLEAVVGEAADRERLHERRQVGHGDDGRRLEGEAPLRRRVGRADLAQRRVREHVVEAEVEVRREKHGHGHVVEPPRGHGVLCAEHGVEVVRVPVVAHEAEDGEPDVGLEAVPLRQRAALVVRERGKHERLRVERQRQAAADEEVGQSVEALVPLEAHDAREGADPDDGVGQKPELGGSLRRVRLRRQPGAAARRSRHAALQDDQEDGLRGQDQAHDDEHRRHRACEEAS